MSDLGEAALRAVEAFAAEPAPRKPTLREEFELDVTGTSGNRGFARRLYDGTLKPQEREALEKCAEVLALREEGKGIQAISEHMRWPYAKVRSFTDTQRFRLMSKYLRERELSQTDKDAHERAVLNRRRWDSFGPKALDYYDWAMRRHVKNDQKKGIKIGDPLDPDRYERAAKMIAEGQGWTAPVPVYAKPRELKPGIIQAQMQAIAAADRKETVVRVIVGDTTVEVGTRSETATMGE